MDNDKKIVKMKSIYNYETLKRFNQFNFYSSKVKKVICVIAFLLIISGTFAFKENVPLKMCCIIIGIAWFLEYLLLPTFFAKRLYKTSKLKNSELNFTFYEEYVEIETYKDDVLKSESKMKYDELYKVCETKTDLYLYISSNQAFCCSKNGMKGNMTRLKTVFNRKLDKKFIPLK